MSGLTDLSEIIAALSVSRRPGRFVVCGPLRESEVPGSGDDGVEALIAEREGWTAVVEVAVAEREGWPVEVVFAWLTLDVHSSLEAVGLTAAVSKALAQVDVPANVLAGSLHDHLLVPEAQAELAQTTIEALARIAAS